jgi:hypothetical protein
LIKEKRDFYGLHLPFSFSLQWGKKSPDSSSSLPSSAGWRIKTTRGQFQKYAQTRNPKLKKMNKIKEKKKMKFQSKILVFVLFRHFLLLILEFCLFRFVLSMTLRGNDHKTPCHPPTSASSLSQSNNWRGENPEIFPRRTNEIKTGN